jgi:PAS domain S-box-containing protein
MNEYYSNSDQHEAIKHNASEERINELETLKVKDLYNPPQLEDIIKMSPAVFFLWRTEKDWPVDMVSTNVSQFGYSTEEFLNRKLPYSAIIFSDDLDRLSDALNSNIQEGLLKPLILEYRILTKTKEIRWIDDRRVARRNDRGEITHYQGVIMDITHRKRMEEEILKEEKLESFEIMASGIAHDFNNMLSVILGNINFAKMILKTEDQASKKLTEAEIACGRAKELAQQLMSFAHGGSINKKVTALPTLIRNAVRFALSSSPIETEYDFEENLFPAEIDEGQIMRAIINIVNNAGEAMPDGGMIRVKAENLSICVPHDFLSSPGDYIKITIQDQGHGIPEPVLGRIFDPYFTTKSLKNEKAMGMGLAMSYSIIKNHKGHITVESSEGVGTSFSIYLPASPKSIFQNIPQETSKAESKGRILFMDDEKMIRDVTGALLTHMGYEVSSVGDGVEVIELYQKARGENQSFSCVILDLTIPGGMGGRRTMQKLLELDPEIKVIISSGYGDDPLIQDFQKYGFKGAITKPYKIEELIDTLQRTIK